MYRTYENPYVIQKRLDEAYETRKRMRAMGCDLYDEIDISMEIADLEERLNFAWQDDEAECEGWDY